MVVGMRRFGEGTIIEKTDGSWAMCVVQRDVYPSRDQTEVMVLLGGRRRDGRRIMINRHSWTSLYDGVRAKFNRVFDTDSGSDIYIEYDLD